MLRKTSDYPGRQLSCRVAEQPSSRSLCLAARALLELAAPRLIGPQLRARCSLPRTGCGSSFRGRNRSPRCGEPGLPCQGRSIAETRKKLHKYCVHIPYVDRHRVTVVRDGEPGAECRDRIAVRVARQACTLDTATAVLLGPKPNTPSSDPSIHPEARSRSTGHTVRSNFLCLPEGEAKIKFPLSRVCRRPLLPSRGAVSICPFVQAVPALFLFLF